MEVRREEAEDRLLSECEEDDQGVIGRGGRRGGGGWAGEGCGRGEGRTEGRERVREWLVSRIGP